MATLFLKRHGNVLYPVGEQGGSDVPMTSAWKDGETLRCEVVKSRNIALHRKAFILLNVVFPNTEYPTKDALRAAMTVGAGYVDTVINPITGETALMPKSWRFERMDEIEFRQLYSRLIDVALQIVAGSSRDDWETAVDEIARL